MTSDQFISVLQSVVGPQAVFTDAENRERFSFDALGPSRLYGRDDLTLKRVDVVVRCINTQQVSSVLRLANEQSVAVIPYGGGTGVMGAVIPMRGGIALDTRGMDQVLEISASERLIRAQPGILLEDLNSAAAQHGLELGHDPWSLPIATLGGAISTDSVGYRASKHGSMGEQVLALEVVMADGSIIRTRPPLLTSSGPGLNGLFIGTEGTMGVITEATVRLVTQPEKRLFATIGFPSFETGYPVVTRLFDIGLIPAIVDLTEEPPGLDAKGFQCLLYLGFEGYREEVNAQRERALYESVIAGGTDLGSKPMERYWRERHDPALRWQKFVQPLRPIERWANPSPTLFDYLHLSLPVSSVLEYYRKAKEITDKHQVVIHEAAVWTNPQLFSLLLRQRAGAVLEKQESFPRAVDELLEEALSVGGGIEYCHGIGLKLASKISNERMNELALIHDIKRMMDPRGTMNPGKLGL